MRRVSLLLFSFYGSFFLVWDRKGRDMENEPFANLVLVVVEERQRLAEAVKLHSRDRNRAPSEPVGKFDIIIFTELYFMGLY